MHWAGDVLYVSDMGRGILRLSANGGQAQMVVPLQEREQTYGPQLLPDGDTLLFTLGIRSMPSWDQAKIVTQSLSDLEGHRRWAPSRLESGWLRTALHAGSRQPPHLGPDRDDAVVSTGELRLVPRVFLNTPPSLRVPTTSSATANGSSVCADVGADGRPIPPVIQVVVNWHEELKQRVPTR